MHQFSQFVTNHWELWLALLVVLILILINEKHAQKNRAQEISPQKAIELINHDNAVVFDLRDLDNFQKGHILNAIRATQEDFEQERMKKYKTKTILLVCPRGAHSSELAAKLRDQGFSKPLSLAGGISAWQKAELPLTKGK